MVAPAQTKEKPQTSSTLLDYADRVFETHAQPDEDFSTVTEIKYSNHPEDSEPKQGDLDITCYPANKRTLVMFWHDGEMHGLNLRDSRSGLECADRTTNGPQPCEPEKEAWIRQFLDQMIQDTSSDSRVSIEHDTQVPEAYVF